MFDNLIESKASKQKRAGGTLLSVVVHAVLITAAVIGTLHASQAMDKPKAEKVEFVTVKKDEPPPPKETPKPPPPWSSSSCSRWSSSPAPTSRSTQDRSTASRRSSRSGPSTKP